MNRALGDDEPGREAQAKTQAGGKGLTRYELAFRAWAEQDPLNRAAALVKGAEALTDDIRRTVEEGAAAALALPPPPVATLFEDVFAQRSPALDRQRADRLQRP